MINQEIHFEANSPSIQSRNIYCAKCFCYTKKNDRTIKEDVREEYLVTQKDILVLISEKKSVYKKNQL